MAKSKEQEDRDSERARQDKEMSPTQIKEKQARDASDKENDARLGRPGASQEPIRKAARDFLVWMDVRSWPAGVVEDRLVGLLGGNGGGKGDKGKPESTAKEDVQKAQTEMSNEAAVIGKSQPEEKPRQRARSESTFNRRKFKKG